MGCNLIGLPPRSPSLPHCGPMKTAMLFREIGRFTRAAEEGRDIISQARGEITDIAPTTAYRVFVLQELLLTSSTLFCLVLTDSYRITLFITLYIL